MTSALRKIIAILATLHCDIDGAKEWDPAQSYGIIDDREAINTLLSNLSRIRRVVGELSRDVRFQILRQCETDADAERIHLIRERVRRLETQSAYLLELIKFVHSGAHGDVPQRPQPQPPGGPISRAQLQAVVRDSRAAKREHAAHLNAFLAAGGTVMQ